MAYTKAQWDALQAKLPPRERESYETYLKYNSPTPTPAAPAPKPAVASAPAPAAAPVATPQEQAALVAQVVAAAIIKSPVVVDTPANVAPNKTAVESIAREIAAVVAPIIAPSLPPASVEVVVKETTKAVVTNPEVKASDIGQAVDTKVAAAVAEKVSTAAPVVNSIAASIPVAGVANDLSDYIPANPPKPASTPTAEYLAGISAAKPAVNPAAETPASTVNRVTVEQGQTLKDIAIANNTTVAAILAMPGNKIIADRVEAGTTPVFGNSKVVIPSTPTPVPVNVEPIETVGPRLEPGDAGFVGPVAPVSTASRTDSAASVGPLGGLGAGVVAGVNPSPIAPVGPIAPVTPIAPITPIVPADKPIEPPAPTTPERTMAIDTFKNTLALFFGAKEVAQPWVNALYGVTSKYYKTGSTIDESLNLALQDVRNNPELAPFTKRFKGVYELQDKLAGGMAVSVPTIAEFFKSQEALGEVMNRAGFADLATQEFLGDVLGTGKSVAETTALINEVFSAIDNAPEQLKRDLAMVAPGADRTSIAKALLLGSKGAAELNKQIAATSVFSAAKSQGLAVDMGTAADYAARGYGYNESLTGFGNVARGQAPLQKLTEISAGRAVKPEDAQKTLQQSIFENNVAAQEQIRLESEKEAARFGGRSGTMGSRSLASRNRANRVI